ncbi:hypothetical protein ACFL21_01490 [Patescibacteria group bacterium]
MDEPNLKNENENQKMNIGNIIKGILGTIVLVLFFYFGITSELEDDSSDEMEKPEAGSVLEKALENNSKNMEESSNKDDPEEVDVVNEVIDDTATGDLKELPEVIDVPVQETPEWYGKNFKVDSEEFDYISMDFVNLWPSYSDRSEVLVSVKRYEEVELIGYESENDYCKVKFNDIEGWTSCAWFVGLPENMIDSWESGFN